MIRTPLVLRTTLAATALALVAACGNRESAVADSAAAASSPDSAALQTTPPQPGGPMNMIDSGTKAPTTGDSAGRDSLRADSVRRP